MKSNGLVELAGMWIHVEEMETLTTGPYRITTLLGELAYSRSLVVAVPSTRTLNLQQPLLVADPNLQDSHPIPVELMTLGQIRDALTPPASNKVSSENSLFDFF